MLVLRARLALSAIEAVVENGRARIERTRVVTGSGSRARISCAPWAAPLCIRC